MSVPESALINRQRYLKDAKGSSFLDAVFLIHFYNRYAKWGGADIAPSEVFDPVDSAEYQLAVARVSRLFTQNSAVGMAWFRYPGSRPYEEEFEIFKALNPGFSESNYKLAANRGIQAMR